MTASAGERKASVPFLAVTALGVVYGDIGTSPLYALRECFFGSHAVPPSYDNVLGVLSLVVYSLWFIISVKYVVVVMRADNQGEGGILALTALISGEGTPRGSRALLVTLGLRRRVALWRRHDHAGHLSTRPGGMARWREQLFIWMVRNASRATTYFGLPADRVVELGVQVEV